MPKEHNSRQAAVPIRPQLAARAGGLRVHRRGTEHSVAAAPMQSTLFNALVENGKAQAANFPFCTIEPNVGDVAVPDERLEKLAAIAGSKEIIPTRLTFVDIAGLVAGASKGEGLGNQFLSHIREVDAILQVVRCFEDPDVIHVAGKVDPVSDMETIELELMLADIQHLLAPLGISESLLWRSR